MLPLDRSSMAPKLLENLEFYILIPFIMFCFRAMMFPYNAKVFLKNDESDIVTLKYALGKRKPFN